MAMIGVVLVSMYIAFFTSTFLHSKMHFRYISSFLLLAVERVESIIVAL